MQETWKQKISWDTALPEHCPSEKDRIKKDYIVGNGASIPRKDDLNENINAQLDICDASSEVYCVSQIVRRQCQNHE